MQVSKRYIKYLLLLVPFLLSAVVFTQTNALFVNILLVLKMIAFLYISASYLKNKFLSRFDFALVIYFVTWLVSVYLNGTSFIEYAKEVVVIISFVFMIEEAFRREEGAHFVFAFGHIIFIELLINLICLVIFPEGLWRTYSIYGDEAVYSFLGLDNQVTPILIVAELILLVMLYYDEFRPSLFYIFYIIVIFGNLLLTMSITGIMGCAIIPLMLILGIRYRKYINIKTGLFTVAGIFLLIVIFRLQNIFAFVIEDLFKKDLTLSNRIGIWDRAIEMIKQKPLLGYGCGTLETIIVDRNAHDFYLQIILQAGLVGFCFYMNIFRVALNDCWRQRNSICSLFISSVLFGYMVCGISEVYSQSWLFILLSMGYCVKLISAKDISNISYYNNDL